jgi:ABC-type transport system involved in cytochrome bd biosynthesis fused ATPase/permease subunit
MRVLRLTFLSSLVLELVAMLSVALVAVSAGLRVVGGDLDFRTALFVLVLAPEAYLPMRALGASYHSSAEGLAATEQVFALLDREGPAAAGSGAGRDVPDPGRVPVRLTGVRVTYPGRPDPALVLDELVLEPGTTLAVTGPSGSGKSTLLAVLLGLVAPDQGEVRVGDVALGDLDLDAWRSQVAWVAQRPYLFAGTLAANVRLGRPDASDADVTAALVEAGLRRYLDDHPAGLRTPVGERGAGLSAGERRRVALARALLRDASLLLLDEPTAGLDPATEAEVVDAVARAARDRTVVLVTHHAEPLRIADRVVELAACRVPAEVTA